MRKFVLFIWWMAILATGAAAQNSQWVGVYTHYEEDLDMDWSRTSYWFRFEVKSEGGRLTAVYSDGINGEARRKLSLTVKAKGRKARVFYDKCLPVAGQESCSESDLARGDLLFELEEAPEQGRTVIYTIWKKINLAAQTESGSRGRRAIFFRKSGGSLKP